MSLDTYDEHSPLNPINRTTEEEINDYHQELINIVKHNRPIIKLLQDWAEMNEEHGLKGIIKKLRK